MAYGLKYRLWAETVKYKDDVKIYILEKDFAGTEEDKYLGAGGVTLTKDNAGVICGTSLSFSIQADSDFEYLAFFESDPREYLVQLLINNTVVWQGYLIGDEYREAFRNPPYDVAVTATDGLGLLKNYGYTVLATPNTKTTRIDVVREVLENTGIILPISVAYNVSSSGGTHLFNISFADDYYAGWTCYEVLEKIIPPDATITQHGNQWMIRRNEQDSEVTPKTYIYTEGLGYIVEDGVAETALSLARMGAGDIYPIGQAELNMQHAWAYMELFSEHGKRPSFLYNHDFADGLTNWTEGSPTGVAVAYDSDNGSYALMEGTYAYNSEDVPDAYIKQSFPYTSVDGEGFMISFKYSMTGWIRFGIGGLRPVMLTFKGRVEITDGVDTYYLDEDDGWSTTNRNFEKKDTTVISGFEWKEMAIFAENPPIESGTVTVYLYPLTTVVNNPSIAFTDIVVHPYVWKNYPNAYTYAVTLQENATEKAEVTILPTSAPDVNNLDRMFYNGQTVSGSRMDAFVSGANTYTYVNLILNSMVFLHGVTRQLLQGFFRGIGLSLNSVISCDATGGRKYIVESGSWEVLNDKYNLNLLEIPGSASGSSWAMGTTDFATSAEWSDNHTAGGGGSSSVGGGGGILVGGGGSWLDPYFELVNGGTSGEYIRALRDFASTGEITAYNANDTTGASIWDAMPIATTGDLGGVIVDGTTITINEQGVISSAATGGGGATDHGGLTGLADDDHPQYLNNTRGDARYQSLNTALTEIAALYAGTDSGTPYRSGGFWALEEYVPLSDMPTLLNTRQAKDADLTAIAAISETVGYLRKTAANTWALDNSTFLTAITKSMVEAVLTGAITSHTHDYEGSISKSTGYLTWNGTAWAWKNETYALSSHNHDTLYEPKLTKSTGYLRWTGSTWEFKNETYLTAITKALVEAVLTGTITSHNHSGVYEPAITKSLGLLYWNGTAWAFDTNSYALASHNHSGVYQPLDADLTAIAGQTGTGFLKRTGTNTWGMAANGANLDTINQDLATDDDVHFASADVTNLEVDKIIDGILQTGYGANLLRYSSAFENALWDKVNCTAADNSADAPFEGSVSRGCLLIVDSSNPVLQQSVPNTTKGNYVFSFWMRSTGSNETVTVKVYSNAQTHSGTAITVTGAWQRFTVYNNLTTTHTTKYVRLEWSVNDLEIWGAQLEAGTVATRYFHTVGLVGSGSGAHIYDSLRVAGNITASDIRAEGDIVATGEVTAYSDARLKHDIKATDKALDKVCMIEVVDYRLNSDRGEKLRTGVIAQQIQSLFPQFVEGSEDDYFSVNYEKLVSVAIKAIQELADKVEKLEKIIAENGITNN